MHQYYDLLLPLQVSVNTTHKTYNCRKENAKKKANKKDLEASASASTADNANDDNQESVLQAIQSMKQSEELQIQIGQIWTQLRGGVDKINKLMEATECLSWRLRLVVAQMCFNQ